MTSPDIIAKSLEHIELDKLFAAFGPLKRRYDLDQLKLLRIVPDRRSLVFDDPGHFKIAADAVVQVWQEMPVSGKGWLDWTVPVTAAGTYNGQKAVVQTVAPHPGALARFEEPLSAFAVDGGATLVG